jgi:hypothetical protein
MIMMLAATGFESRLESESLASFKYIGIWGLIAQSRCFQSPIILVVVDIVMRMHACLREVTLALGGAGLTLAGLSCGFEHRLGESSPSSGSRVCWNPGAPAEYFYLLPLGTILSTGKSTLVESFSTLEYPPAF